MHIFCKFLYTMKQKIMVKNNKTNNVLQIYVGGSFMKSH